MTTPQVREGQAPHKLSRAEFGDRFRQRFYDPAFEAEAAAVARLEEIAWQAYAQGRRAPRTRPAGEGFARPEMPLSVQWLDTRERLRQAQQRWHDADTRTRVLLVSGAARNDGSCPGEMSKTYRLAGVARETLAAQQIDTDVLDLSLMTSEYARQIHPCKGCVSTAMPLCHWPCSCYPHHGLGQSNDWMAEIYERWVSAHGVLLLTPTYWYQSPSPLKLMMDRLVCADGGNPDPTRTNGKDAAAAKALELAGWPYPQHLAGRVYGVVVHGDVAGVEDHRRALCDWLDWMGLTDAGTLGRLDRYIGYYQPYATSHDELDRDPELMEEVRNVARALGQAAGLLRAGRLSRPGAQLSRPRRK
jgi:multimeric flavodoxin WrbA